jgi:hypothetical protein
MVAPLWIRLAARIIETMRRPHNANASSAIVQRPDTAFFRA